MLTVTPNLQAVLRRAQELETENGRARRALTRRLVVLSFLILLGSDAQAQPKDMPSQTEFDPILENADTTLKDLTTTLTKFHAEAVAMDSERYGEDLRDFAQLRELLKVTSADGGHDPKRGINMGRLVLILSGVDDAAIEAAIWKNAAELQMCQRLIQHQDPSRYDQFSTQMAMDLTRLRDAGRELFHPTVRMADATDEIMLAVANAATKGKPNAH
jgi:hypothetical protein